MFPGEVVFAVFLGMIPIGGLAVWLDNRSFHSLASALFTISVVAGLYCVLAGIFLVADSEDPFASIDAEDAKTIGRAAAHGRGRGAILLLIIRFWPYVLVGLGGYIVYNAGLTLWYKWRS